MILTRKKLEEKEEKNLEPYAVTSRKSRGRVFKENEDAHRLVFQKDRDRIIHCKAFRRLEAKTQVFIAHTGDHYRNRLTHTLEVAQISRDIARNLGVNEDLAEAIALAHDLGHTPFGHAGEEALDELMGGYGSHFEHNEQSLRIVESLEKLYPDYAGLNLTLEVREGLMKHETPYDRQKKTGEKKKRSASIEAQIVNLADEIAYTNHDIDDGLRSGLITFADLEEIELWRYGRELVMKKNAKRMPEYIMRSRMVSNLMGMMIGDVLEETERRLMEDGIETLEDMYAAKRQLVNFSEPFGERNRALKKFLYERLYGHEKVRSHNRASQEIIKKLFETFMRNPQEMPAQYKEALNAGEKTEIVVKDYIAGMTDGYATEKIRKLC